MAQLMNEPLKPEHVKDRLLGHWGASAGLAFCYTHCGIGSWGAPGGAVSENGRLRQGAGGYPRSDRRRSVLMLPTLSS
jgi:XFP N-terminal domain